MKLFILSFIMSLFPLFSFGQSYDKLWKQVENFEDDGKPKSAYDVAAKILTKAIRGNGIGQVLSARLKMAALHQEWAPDSFFTDIQELEALRTAEKRPEARAVYASLLAEIYQMNSGRSQASGLELTSDDMKEWTREQYDSAAATNWRLSMQDLTLLAKARSKDWLPFIKQNEQSAYFKHDLLHVLWYRAKNQDKDIWRGTQKTLAALAQDVIDEYKRLGNREAALLISLDWVKLQEKHSESLLLRQLIQDYADLSLCTEAYLQLFVKEGSKQECIALARECLSRYPKYDRISEVRNQLNNFLKPSISWRGNSIYYPGKEYPWVVNSSNAKRLTFEIFRMPKTFHKNNLSGTREKILKEIRQMGAPVQSFTKDLSVEHPWDERYDTIPWTALEQGTYALIITGEASETELLLRSAPEQQDRAQPG